MRTTVRINDDLLKRARKRAAEEGRTLTSLIEDGLVIVLAQAEKSRMGLVKLPVSQASGGILPGVDLNRSCELEEVMNKP